ncbi:MAG: hypothetical protein A2X97_09270 [Bdellovibrionales bacterium GWA1_52_35]|nr:MAG: hypothetical protein A2X97_09270 [Bdellovibrionales bacterium GWA1_52_35]HCM38883.1 hypothetical protein [Bdellovibrionales bacterium]
MRFLHPRSIRNFICSSVRSVSPFVLGFLLLTPNANAISPWAKIDRLIEEQKLQAASNALQPVLEEARSAKADVDWTQALVVRARVQIALHSYEKAISGLLEQPWPEDCSGRFVLHLTTAKALTAYAQAYEPEIRKREKVLATPEPDQIKAWTLRQVYSEAERNFAAIWKERALLEQYRPEQFRKYFDPGNLPAGIRPTLRDTYSYLYADFLVDSRGWGPSGDGEPLDPGKLIEFTEKNPLELFEKHPLLRLTAVLNDLESSHQTRNPEAALEARLELFRQLFSRFTQSSDRQFLAEKLETTLNSFRAKYPGKSWWAAGVAQLAQFLEYSDAPDALMRAQVITKACAAAMSGTFGGNQCLAIQKRIEAPAYDIYSMAVDGIGRPSIQVTFKNLDKLYFRAYAYDLKSSIGRKDFKPSDPAERPLQELLGSRQPDFSWSSDLPKTADFRMTETFLKHQITREGFYRVVVSGQPGFEAKDNSLSAFYFSISPFVIVRQQFPGAMEFEIYNGDDGQPVRHARTTLYRHHWGKIPELYSTRHTNASGNVRFDSKTRGHRFAADRSSWFLVVEKNGRFSWQPVASGFQVQAKTTEQLALLYSDRGIYRPLQKIRWKIVTVSKTGGMPEIRPLARVSVDLLDANGQVVGTKSLKTNEFGSGSGEFVVPSGKLAGIWALSCGDSSLPIRIEEYKRPTFEVALLDPAQAFRLNQLAVLKGRAAYHFGQQLTHGTVQWRVEREPVIRFSSERILIASGETKLQADGTFVVSFTPDRTWPARRNEKAASSYYFRVTAGVTNEGGETRETARSFRIGDSSIEAFIENLQAGRPGAGFYSPQERPVFAITRRTLDGAPSAGSGSYKVVRLQLPKEIVLPSDRPRWRTEYSLEAYVKSQATENSTPVSSGSIQHDLKGEARVELDALASGIYRLIYETQDASGVTSKVESEFLVMGASLEVFPVPALLAVKQAKFKVGETARVWVVSGWKHQFLSLNIYQDGKRLSKREFRAGELGFSGMIEIPITEGLRGGFSLTLATVRDYQLITQTAAVEVPWDNKELKLSFSSFRDRLKPGAREIWKIKVATRKLTEVLAYMFDRSLDLFGAHQPPGLLELFPKFPNARIPTANLQQAPSIWVKSFGFNPPPSFESASGEVLKEIASHGIGGPGRARDFVYGRFDGSVRSEMNKSLGAVALASRSDPVQQVRSNFAETAFWFPHITTGSDGSAILEFPVPDSVTGWHVWLHAFTRDLQSGMLEREVRTTRELLARPYLPRFLREGDETEIRVVVSNQGDRRLEGKLTLEISDPETGQSLLPQFAPDYKARNFSIEPEASGAGTVTLLFPIRVPARLGAVNFKVVAQTEELSDGELRTLPILPGRLHLVQSQFAILKEEKTKKLNFPELEKSSDATLKNEQLVITLDAQLVYSVLAALPYLLNYPHESTEQLVSSFAAAGTLASLYKKYPAIQKAAAKLAKERKSQFQTFDLADRNRKMAFEEMPWLELAKDQGGGDLLNVLDPVRIQRIRNEVLSKLLKVQNSDGGFPWFPGGSSDPYMTIYILSAFGRSLESGIEPPREPVTKAWAYLHEHKAGLNNTPAIVTFMSYALSVFPDEWAPLFKERERHSLLDFSFKSWKEHSPYLKSFLALTLKRMGRLADARLVWDSVMDSAKTSDEEGTHWAAEDHTWLWYNDEVETHALALKTSMELQPSNQKQAEGLVRWLLLNKKLNHWKSTRATAQALDSLITYLRAFDQLSAREEGSVKAGGQSQNFNFSPGEYTGTKRQLSFQASSPVILEKRTPGYVFVSAAWHYSTETLPNKSEGDFLSVERKFFRRSLQGAEPVLEPVSATQLRVGDEIEVHLLIRAKHNMEYIHLQDPRAAGFEPLEQISHYRWNQGVSWYEELRDSGTYFFFDHLPAGEVVLKYRIKAANTGVFKIPPAVLQGIYAPEFNAYSAGRLIEIQK